MSIKAHELLQSSLQAMFSKGEKSALDLKRNESASLQGAGEAFPQSAISGKTAGPSVVKTFRTAVKSATEVTTNDTLQRKQVDMGLSPQAPEKVLEVFMYLKISLLSALSLIKQVG